MTKTPASPAEARDLRRLLETVVDALTLPCSVNDYDQRILRRASLVRVLVHEALAEKSDSLGWNTDYLRTQLAAEQHAATEQVKDQCGRCSTPFDAADASFDGRARYGETPWCRSCVDNCHEGSAEHSCVICNPARYGVEGQ